MFNTNKSEISLTNNIKFNNKDSTSGLHMDQFKNWSMGMPTHCGISSQFYLKNESRIKMQCFKLLRFLSCLP